MLSPAFSHGQSFADHGAQGIVSFILFLQERHPVRRGQLLL